MLAASFVMADATVRYVSRLGCEEVTFVLTGRWDERGDEDLACAEYLEAVLRGVKPDPAPFVRRVFDSRDALQHLDPAETAFPRSDLDLCTRIDRFDFAMPISREQDRLIMRRVKPHSS
jgi:2-phosphosulfolactate phosphatase